MMKSLIMLPWWDPSELSARRWPSWPSVVNGTFMRLPFPPFCLALEPFLPPAHTPRTQYQRTLTCDKDTTLHQHCQPEELVVRPAACQQVEDHALWPVATPFSISASWFSASPGQ